MLEAWNALLPLLAMLVCGSCEYQSAQAHGALLLQNELLTAKSTDSGFYRNVHNSAWGNVQESGIESCYLQTCPADSATLKKDSLVGLKGSCPG
jgi:hypothetical protein